MKQTFITFLIPVIFLLISGKDHTIPSEKLIERADGIVGTWKLTMETFDDNNNNKLDDDERKSGMKNSTPQALHDYKIPFNANGTCKVEGRYNGKFKQTEGGAKNILTLHIDAYVNTGEGETDTRHHQQILY